MTNAKIEGIYGELRMLQLSKHVHSIGVLLRVFLEMSVDDYLENKAGSTLTFKDPNSGRMLDKKLKDKVKETIAHMVAAGAVEKDFKGVTTALNDPLNPFSIDTLHAYIHNRFFTPTDTHLVTGWDNGQPLFERDLAMSESDQPEHQGLDSFHAAAVPGRQSETGALCESAC